VASWASRSQFYNILNNLASEKLGLTVDALGACGGEGGAEVSSRREKRFTHSWHDDAVVSYRDYQFVIAFENVIEPRYVTEKITNAMLANSVAIYWGTEDVKKVFNEKSFIYCNEGELVECAERVISIYLNKNALMEMVGEDFGVSEEVLKDEFGYLQHADARVNVQLKDALLKTR